METTVSAGLEYDSAEKLIVFLFLYRPSCLIFFFFLIIDREKEINLGRSYDVQLRKNVDLRVTKCVVVLWEEGLKNQVFVEIDVGSLM